jgi:hypothetical protein
MARYSTRNDDWGFPRWRPYGSERAAAQVRLCDREGCTAAGDRPAPKSPNSPERWYFCETHAGEYNKRWDYFQGLSAEEAEAREQAESGERRYRRADHWAWGEGDGSRSRAEMDALRALELDADADEAAVKAAHRRLVKLHHPDRNAGDADAAAKFQAIQAAYEVLNRAAERRAAVEAARP